MWSLRGGQTKQEGHEGEELGEKEQREQIETGYSNWERGGTRFSQYDSLEYHTNNKIYTKRRHVMFMEVGINTFFFFTHGCYLQSNINTKYILQ